jgi:hypothetical protein
MGISAKSHHKAMLAVTHERAEMTVVKAPSGRCREDAGWHVTVWMLPSCSTAISPARRYATVCTYTTI